MKEEIIKILEKAGAKESNIRPTFLYNEGWLLNIILQQINEKEIVHPDLSFPDEEINWYSEALLPSPFLARMQKDKFSEKHTHADGVVGKFEVGIDTKVGLSLKESCDFFYVIEAKMYSPLSPRITNAENYNQAARTIACIAKLIYDKKIPIESFKKLGFYVLLPESQMVKVKYFKEYTDKENVKEKILERIKQYPQNDPEKKDVFSWLKTNLDNFLEKLEIKLISWEELIEKSKDPTLLDFYGKCKKYNKK